jgi:hypothetical protein
MSIGCPRRLISLRIQVPSSIFSQPEALENIRDLDPGNKRQMRSPKLLQQVRSTIRTRQYSIRTVQELLGHQDVRTMMIHTHVLNRPGLSVRSPFDAV